MGVIKTIVRLDDEPVERCQSAPVLLVLLASKRTNEASEKVFTDSFPAKAQTKGIMARKEVHKTTHIPRLGFAIEDLYQSPTERVFTPLDARIQRGCRVAGAVFRAAEDPDEQDYLNTQLTPALVGSAWQDAFLEDHSELPNDLMYRVVELPRVDLVKEKQDAATSVWVAGLVHVEAAGDHKPFSFNRVNIDKQIISMARSRRAFRPLTSASLWLGAVDTARQVETGVLHRPELIQAHVRENGYEMTRATQRIARKLGCLPTISQLTDGYSPLTVNLMRTGPRHLTEAYLEAMEPLRQAA